MKKHLLMLGILTLLISSTLIPISLGSNINISKKTKLSQNYEPEGTTLITEFQKMNFTNVSEIDSEGNILWKLTNLDRPLDAERLSNGNTLITFHGGQKVIEVESGIGPSIIVWEYKTGEQSLPTDAERLPNGNTLISDFNKGVIEVDKNGDVVWEITDLHKPMDVERLPNGNTLITEGEHYPDSRVIEVDMEGNEVWNISGLDGSLDAERLPNGNTLITTHIHTHGGKVTEYNETGEIEWQKTGLAHPQDAERLPNGNTLICETGKFGPNRVIEINPDGEIVWLMETTDYPVDAERLPNEPPDKPTNPSPENGALDIDINPYLSVNVTDPDGNMMDVSFYNAADDSLIGTDLKVASGGTAKVQWNDLSFDTKYSWYAIAYDLVNETKSDTWSFTTLIIIEITNPKEGYFHFRDRPLFPFVNKTFVYGTINIKVNIASEYASGLDKVELYINGKLEKTFSGGDDSYEYKWGPIICGRYTIKTTAYDNQGRNTSDNIVLFKWRAHPILIFTGFILLFGMV